MAADPTDVAAVNGVGFGDYCRAHAGALVSLSLLRGVDLVEAARLAQDSMTVARRWMVLLGANAAGAAKDTRTPWSPRRRCGPGRTG